jgi:serine/threonine-protein kinase
LTDHRRKTLQRGAAFGRYLETSRGAGHLVYLNRGTLFAVAFDPEKLELRGAPTAVLQDVAYSAGTGSGRFDFSPKNGTLVYRSASGVLGGELRTVQWLDAAGKIQPLLAKPDSYLFPHLSSNDQRLVFSTTDVWFMNYTAAK